MKMFFLVLAVLREANYYRIVPQQSG